MNPYKKIDRLEQRIHQLEQDKQELLLQHRDIRTCQEEYERNNRLAIRYQAEYQQLLHELKQEQEEVRQLLHHLKYNIGKNAGTYRHALHDIIKDIRTCRTTT